jgi:hypothetical protein
MILQTDKDKTSNQLKPTETCRSFRTGAHATRTENFAFRKSGHREKGNTTQVVSGRTRKRA